MQEGETQRASNYSGTRAELPASHACGVVAGRDADFLCLDFVVRDKSILTGRVAPQGERAQQGESGSPPPFAQPHPPCSF